MGGQYNGKAIEKTPLTLNQDSCAWHLHLNSCTYCFTYWMEKNRIPLLNAIISVYHHKRKTLFKVLHNLRDQSVRSLTKIVQEKTPCRSIFYTQECHWLKPVEHLIWNASRLFTLVSLQVQQLEIFLLCQLVHKFLEKDQEAFPKT